MTDKIETANPDWKYPTTMPGVLYNELGVPLAINSVKEYNDAKETGYQYFNYEDAPGRPKDTFDLTKPQTGVDVQWVSAEDSQTGEIINELRYTPTGQEKRRSEEAKAVSKEAVAFNETKRLINTIIADLTNATSGKDLDAIKTLEKLKDPTGVIRESDISTIQSALGGWSDTLEKYYQSIVTGKTQYLNNWERDQLVEVALTVFEQYKNTFENFMLVRKSMYESITAPKAWKGGVLKFETVFPKKAGDAIYSKLLEYQWQGPRERLRDPTSGNILIVEPPTEGMNTTGSAPSLLDALNASGTPTVILKPRRQVPSRLSP
jgi:hypothetical protein